MTLALRSAMLPLAFSAMRNAARMAIVKPELDMVLARLKSDPQVHTGRGFGFGSGVKVGKPVNANSKPDPDPAPAPSHVSAGESRRQ